MSSRLPDLDDAMRRYLLDVARRSLETMVRQRPYSPDPPEEGSPLDRDDGVFVTLKRREQLRGCIGRIAAGGQALPESVASLARSAAREDPRFPPLRGEELDDLRIEVTILSPLEPIDGPEQVEIGRHGLVVERGGRRGLLLPQVATENGWDARRFVERTCWKAGLPEDAWRDGGRLYRFEAVFFAEGEGGANP